MTPAYISFCSVVYIKNMTNNKFSVKMPTYIMLLSHSAQYGFIVPWNAKETGNLINYGEKCSFFNHLINYINNYNMYISMSYWNFFTIWFVYLRNHTFEHKQSDQIWWLAHIHVLILICSWITKSYYPYKYLNDSLDSGCSQIIYKIN